MSAASRRADAPIYVVDVGGSSPSDLQADQRRLEDVGPTLDEQQAVRAGLASLAAENGGVAITGAEDLARGLERLEAESRHYYLLGYQPTNRVSDGKFRRIRVSVRRPGVQVRARPGYFAVPADPSPDAGRDREDPARPIRRGEPTRPSPCPASPCGCRAYTFDATREGTTRTLLVSELRIDDLTFEEKKGQFSAELDVLLTVTHYATGRTLGDRPVGIQLAARSDVRGQNAWHRITQEVDLAPRRLGGQGRGPGPPERGHRKRHPLAGRARRGELAGLLSGAERRRVGRPEPRSCSTRCRSRDGRSPRPAGSTASSRSTTRPRTRRRAFRASPPASPSCDPVARSSGRGRSCRSSRCPTAGWRSSSRCRCAASSRATTTSSSGSRTGSRAGRRSCASRSR